MWLLTNNWTLLGGICAWRSHCATCSTVQVSEGVIILELVSTARRRVAAGLAALDTERADELSRNDWYRLHRALVVAMQTETGPKELGPPDDGYRTPPRVHYPIP